MYACMYVLCPPVGVNNMGVAVRGDHPTVFAAVAATHGHLHCHCRGHWKRKGAYTYVHTYIYIYMYTYLNIFYTHPYVNA